MYFRPEVCHLNLPHLDRKNLIEIIFFEFRKSFLKLVSSLCISSYSGKHYTHTHTNTQLTHTSTKKCDYDLHSLVRLVPFPPPYGSEKHERIHLVSGSPYRGPFSMFVCCVRVRMEFCPVHERHSCLAWNTHRIHVRFPQLFEVDGTTDVVQRLHVVANVIQFDGHRQTAHK